MAPKINAYIDNLDAQMADRLTEAARLGRNRFEVVLDRIDGDHIDQDFHFRLVELTATQYVGRHEDPHIARLRADVAEAVRREDIVTEFRHGQPEYRTKDGRLLTEDELAGLTESERRRYPLRTVHVGGSYGSEPVMELGINRAELTELNVTQLAKLLASIINLAKISPRVLGVEDGEGPAYKRIMDYLRKR